MTKEQQVQKDQYLKIARFMDYKIQNNVSTEHVIVYNKSDGSEMGIPGTIAHFSTSWDWLIPVAQKVMDLNLWMEVEGNLIENIIKGFKESKKELFEALLVFIDWFNDIMNS